MNIDRLKILRDHLWTLRAQQRRGKVKRVFDLQYWVTVGGPKTKDSACGTAACAVGEAAFIPGFREMGLEIEGDLRGRRSRYRGRDLDVSYRPGGEYGDVRYYGTSAAEQFFGLDQHNAERLFLPEEYPRWQRKSPKAVARRIDALLGGRTI